MEESTLDVEVLDVEIHFAEPGPLLVVLSNFDITLVNSRVQLEAIVLEVDLYKQGDSLLLIVLDHYLLGDRMQIWKITSNSPFIFNQIVGVAFFIFITSGEEDVDDLAFHSLWEDTWSDKLSWHVLGLRHSWFTSSLSLVWELDDETSSDGDSVGQWENEEPVLANVEDILDKHVFLFTNFAVWVLLSLTKLLEVNELLRPLMTLHIKLMLVIMEPCILLEINLLGVALACKFDPPKYLILEVKMHLWIDAWEQFSLIHYLRNNRIVEILFVNQVKGDHFVDGEELGNDLHATS